MKRRASLRAIVLVAAATAALASTLYAAQAGRANDANPNIIFLMADDWGYGDLSCYGQRKFRTPHIDRLAAEGMKFTQHYSGSTVCAPSRCALMTGLHTGHAQVRGNREVKPEGQAPMRPGTVTIPTLLRRAGYVSGMFGKWGLGAPGSDSDPTVFFDEVYGYNCQRQAHTFYPKHLWHNRTKVALDGQTYSHDLILKAAKDFIRANRHSPFFCYMPVTIPHAAMHAPKDLHDKYRKRFPRFEERIGKYAGTDSELDDESYIIVPNGRRSDGFGGTDYYISFRDEDDTWVGPFNLGSEVNFPFGKEWSAYVSPDGAYLFFMSDRGSDNSGRSRIFWVDAAFLNEMNPNRE